jgi:hypothetical protein
MKEHASLSRDGAHLKYVDPGRRNISSTTINIDILLKEGIEVGKNNITYHENINVWRGESIVLAYWATKPWNIKPEIR